MIVAGHSPGDVARILWLQPRTVRKHLEHVYDKLGARSRTHAAARALALWPAGAR
jgi:DNA-binding CsgD family transcriptional regulator